jgi:spermidine synthase
MLWLTHNDAEIVGSNAPIMIDEADLARRIAEPAIADDLQRVMMGSATEFLSYFVMGTGGMKKFGQGAIVNTDDNLYLEFSAPYSIGKFAVMGENVTAILQNRESIVPYLLPARGEAARAEQVKKWTANMAAAETAGPAHALFLEGRHETPEFKKYLTELDAKYPWYAPGRFLKNEYLAQAALKPELLEKTAFVLFNERGGQVRIEISAVLVPISRERASVVFVDNNAKIIYGQVTVPGYDKNTLLHGFVRDVLTSIQAAYQQEAELALRQDRGFPPAGPTMQRIKGIIADKVQRYQES